MRAAALAVALAALLAPACAPSPDAGARQGEARASYRRSHREFDGAPPVVPHAVAALGRQDCLGCHLEGMDLGEDGLAPSTPHPERVQCLQCHVEQLTEGLLVANGFSGLRHPPHGTRAFPGAPPTLPHPRQGREGCNGCHGTNGGSPLRTPHPDRVNCLQCHIEQAPDARHFRANTFAGRS